MTKRTLIICATYVEANCLARELLESYMQGTMYKSRMEVVNLVGEEESTVFRTLRQLDSMDGYRFDKVTITDNAYKNGSIVALNKAIYLKGMLTAHIPREEPL